MKHLPPLSEGTANLIKSKKRELNGFLDQTIDEMRKSLATMYLTDAPKIEISNIENRIVDFRGHIVPVRIYSNSSKSVLPILVYFHGGGWVLGDLDAQDRLCRLVAKSHECVVVNVDYRLAPENKFPAAIDDGIAVLGWVCNQSDYPAWDTNQIVLAGDSAGGNLAAVVGKKFNLSNLLGNIVQSIMIYPVTDLTNFERSSYNNFGKGYMLDKMEMIWFRDMYLDSKDQAKLPEVSPIIDEEFHYYPPIVVITAGYDVLRDEGFEFAEKLKQAGHKCELIEFNNLTHSFLRFVEFDENAKSAVDDVVKLIGNKWK